jgi:hypothetical protein
LNSKFVIQIEFGNREKGIGNKIKKERKSLPGPTKHHFGPFSLLHRVAQPFSALGLLSRGRAWSASQPALCLWSAGPACQSSPTSLNRLPRAWWARHQRSPRSARVVPSIVHLGVPGTSTYKLDRAQNHVNNLGTTHIDVRASTNQGSSTEKDRRERESATNRVVAGVVLATAGVRGSAGSFGGCPRCPRPGSLTGEPAIRRRCQCSAAEPHRRVGRAFTAPI